MMTKAEVNRRAGGRKMKPVSSSQGRATTRNVTIARLLSAVATALAVILLGQAFGVYHADPAANVNGYLAGAVGVALVAGVLAGAELIIGTRGARQEEKRIRRRVLQAAFDSTTLPKAADEEADSGALITMVTQNAEKMTEFRQQYWGSTRAALMIPVLVVAYVAIAIDFWLGLGMAIAVPVMPLLVGGFLKVLRKVSRNSRMERARLTTQYMDALRNLVVIRLSGAGERLEQRLAAQGERNRGAIMRLLAGNQRVIIVIDGVLSLMMICWSVFLMSRGIDAGRLTFADAVTTMFLLVLLLEPMTQLAGFFYIGMAGIASEKIIGRYLDAERAKQDAAKNDAAKHEAAKNAVGKHDDATDMTPHERETEPRLAVVMADVDYDYGRGQVLHGVNFALEPGEKAAIVGRSGAGKSTLLSILRGSLPLQRGRVAIGGHDLTGLTPAQIRALSATVSQSTWLFNGTIATNLKIAKPDATEAEMWQALEEANVAGDVRGMPLGLDTPVGERGAQLSGGQGQRISLARALISGRKILFLDEPTSQVDLESEAAIVHALAGVGEERSMVIVTHRHSLLDIADSVYTMADGRLEANNDN